MQKSYIYIDANCDPAVNSDAFRILRDKPPMIPYVDMISSHGETGIGDLYGYDLQCQRRTVTSHVDSLYQQKNSSN